MAVRSYTRAVPNKIDQSITRLLCTCRRTRLVGTAGAVHLSGCDAGQPNARSFCAPDWPVAVPHMRWGAGEGLTCRHYEGSCEKDAHRANLAQVPKMPVEREQHEQRPEGERGKPRLGCLDRHDRVRASEARTAKWWRAYSIFLHGTISEHRWPPRFGRQGMFILDPAAVLALAALITALSALVWSVRRKP